MKIHPVEAVWFHADGQMDLTKQTVAFHNFWKCLIRNNDFFPQNYIFVSSNKHSWQFYVK